MRAQQRLSRDRRGELTANGGHRTTMVHGSLSRYCPGSWRIPVTTIVSSGMAQRWPRSMWPGEIKRWESAAPTPWLEERDEHILRAHSTAEDGGAGEALKRGLEAKAEVVQRVGRRWVGGEKGPRGCGGRTRRGVEEVDECDGVGLVGPPREETVEE